MDDCTHPKQPPQDTDGHTKKRKLLSDILAAGVRSNDLAEKWKETRAADDYGKALPAGQYVARLIAGDLTNSRRNAFPEFKLIFEIIEGEYMGRRIWHDIYLTELALPMAKRDLGKLGVSDLAQLERPLPQGIVCLVKLALRKDNDGFEFNKVKAFDVLRIDAPEPDAFAPSDTKPTDGHTP